MNLTNASSSLLDQRCNDSGEEDEMAAYIIAEHKITDAAKFEEYRIRSTLEEYNRVARESL